VTEDNENKDLSSRLGRRRLRTASRKGMETQSAPELEGVQQGTGSVPSSQMPSVQAPPAPGVSGEQAPVGGGAMSADAGPQAAPAPAVQIDFDAFTKKGNKLAYILAGICAVLGLGLGYCSGHRVEQNKLANMAKADAKNIFNDINNVQQTFNSLSKGFNAMPTKLTDWTKQFEKITMKPDITVAGRSKLTFIPNPRERKAFLRDLITYYANIIQLNNLYNNYVDFINSTIAPYTDLFAAIEKMPGKNTGDKLRAYMAKSIKERGKAITDKKGVKFLVLMDGSIHRSFIVPFDARNMVCPTDVNLCPCDPASKPRKGQPCTRKCEAKCQDYQKVYSFKLAGQKREFTFNPAVNKKMLFTGARVALKFEQIAPRSLQMIASHEIMLPVSVFMAGAQFRYREIAKLIKATEKLPGNLLKTLKDASNRKKRGLL